MSNTNREIHSQYEALKNTQTAIDGHLGAISALFENSTRLIFTGSGSSYSLAVSGAMIARTKLGIDAMALPAGDMILHLSTYGPLCEGAVVIALTRSGATTEVVRAVEGLRDRGVSSKLLTFSCVADSTLSRMSDLAVELPWAFDESVCQTRTVSNLYFACAYMAAKLSGDDALSADLLKTVEQGPAYMARVEPILKGIAQKSWTHAVVLGDAELAGLCDEGALTFKEICQLPSNYYHLLDVRHGPMVVIKEDTLVVAVLSDPTNKLELDLIKDAVNRGAEVVAYSDMPLDMPGITSLSFGEALGHTARGIPFIAICQLLSFHKSFLTGADPDKPEGLSAWIKLS